MVTVKKRFLITAFILLIIAASLALAQGRILVSKDPSKIFFHLGKESFYNNDYGNATSNFQKAIELNRNYEEAYHNLGIIHYKKREYQEAISSFQKAVQINKNYEKAHYSLGLLYYELKDYDKAIASLKKITLINPNNPNAHFDLAVIFVERFRETKSSTKYLEQALNHYQKVQQINPGFPHAAQNAQIVQDILNNFI